jgi:ABC-type transport system involved in multi-copper enzyme maturation permease subunit
MLLQIASMGAVLVVAVIVQSGTEALTASLFQALWLLMINTTVVTSLALFFSSFSSPFLSGFFALGLFVLGRSVPDLRFLASKSPGALGQVVEVASYLLPNLHLFTPSGNVQGSHAVSVHGAFVSGGYVVWTTAYGLGYSLVALLAAIAVFRRRDFV